MATIVCFLHFLSYLINVFLVKENEEDDIVSETSDAVHGGHFNDEGENVVDECIQGLVRHHPPGKVGHRLQPEEQKEGLHEEIGSKR